MDRALAAGILLFNVESEPELALLEARAQSARRKAPFGIRINPDVAAETHPHIATGLHRHKFGVEAQQAAQLYAVARKSKWLQPTGVSFHIGSQILDPGPFAEAAQRICSFVRELRTNGDRIEYFDIGGGLGIGYRADQYPPRVLDYAKAIIASIGELNCTVLMEPGRRILGPAGALLTRVLYIKQNAGKTFVITDAGYNDLIRPVLYGAYHEIIPVRPRAGEPRIVDIVGPICETADSFARDRELLLVNAGDLLAILDAGAYGFAISSNYNARCRPAEVLIEDRAARLIRRRETYDDLLACEQEFVQKQTSTSRRAGANPRRRAQRISG
jgi:diaminopimelate decarboxylase